MTNRPDRNVAHSLPPLQLVTPQRLDLVCKYLYFRELSSLADSSRAETSPAAQLYRKHIALRTGGVEPPDPFQPGPEPMAKQSVDDYVRHAKALWSSLRTNGFDSGAAVSYFPDGTLGNGAHRISAALALDMPIVARRHEGHGTAWGFNWFVENGFSTEELQRLLYAYAHLKADRIAVFVFYAPARNYWDMFLRAVADAFYLVGSVDVAIESGLGTYELVHDIYATLEPLSSTDVINRKALLLAMVKPLAFRVVLAERRHDSDDVYCIADDVKSRCRQLASDAVAPGSYLAAHAGASRSETLNLTRVLLSPNNLRQLGRRRTAGARAELLSWLGRCRATCVQADIALDDICVVGSSPLEVIGVRPSTDVDFTLRSMYRKARYGSGVTQLAPSVDIVTEGYHRSRERPAISDDDLIDNPDLHFIFRGVKFANPEIVLDQKDFYRRDKDVRDVELAASMSPAAVSEFDPAFQFASRCETMLRDLARSQPPTTRTASDIRRSAFLQRVRTWFHSRIGRPHR